MKKLIAALSLGAVLTCSGIAGAEEAYMLTPGDQLQILVTGHADISSPDSNRNSSYIVRPDGRFEFPLIGVVETRGKTVSVLEQELEKRLSEFIIDPDITINITTMGTTRVFVLGEVKRAGMFELTKNHRVLDALGAAGGFTEKAAKKRVYLIRNGREDTVQQINMNKFLTKGDVSQNVVLQEGDCLYLTSNHKVSFLNDILLAAQRIMSGYYYYHKGREVDE